MVLSPVQIAGKPLWKDNGSGVLLPAWSDSDANACTCCGSSTPYDFCDCTCAQWNARITSYTLTVKGMISFSCTACDGHTSNINYAAMNGSYSVPYSTGQLDLGIVTDPAHRGLPIADGFVFVSGVCRPVSSYLCTVSAAMSCTFGLVELGMQNFFTDTNTWTGSVGFAFPCEVQPSFPEWTSICHGASGTGQVTLSGNFGPVTTGENCSPASFTFTPSWKLSINGPSTPCS